MIRFRNPGTQYTTQVQVFRELYKEYKDAPSIKCQDRMYKKYYIKMYS